MNTDKFRNLLVSRREELEAAIEQASDSRGPVELDQQSVGRVSRIDAIQRQAMAKAGEQRKLNELSRIAAALHRVEEGEYGYCVKCGDDIAIKRLEFDPSAPLCIACAKG